MKLKNFLSKATDGLLNDNFRQSFLVCVLSALLFFISIVASITHLVKDTDKTFGIIMSVLGVICLTVFLLTIFVNKHQIIWRRIFMGLIIIFFGYLCYDGGPDGFLHVWILLIPAFSFITFGLIEGFATAIPVMIVMIAFFWWPLSGLRKYASEQDASQGGTPQYIDGQIAVFSVNLRIRLSLMYIVSMSLGFFAELVRHIAAKRLRGYTENFRYASMHDTLTGLANQNFLAKYLDDVCSDKVTNQSLGCLFVDIDVFKAVNDNYGHLFGNVVLIKVGEILSEEKEAFVCRWGGDEFVVCFTNVDEERLKLIGEKYRTAISACRFKDVPQLHVTVSIGAVVIPVDDNFNFDHVLELADFANRTAKGNGKDNVTLAKK